MNNDEAIRSESDDILLEKLIAAEVQRLRDSKLSRSEILSRLAQIEKETQQLNEQTEQTLTGVSGESDEIEHSTFITVRHSRGRNAKEIEWDKQQNWSLHNFADKLVIDDGNNNESISASNISEAQHSSVSLSDDVELKFNSNRKKRKEMSLYPQHHSRFSLSTNNSDELLRLEKQGSKNLQQLFYMPDAFDYSTDLTGGQGSKKRLSEIKSFADKVAAPKAVEASEVAALSKQSLLEVKNTDSSQSETYDSVTDGRIDEFPSQQRSRKSTLVSEFGDVAAVITAEETISETAAPNVFEFCIVEADWSYLSDERLKDMSNTLLTPLLPPRQLWRYPDTGDMVMNDLKQSQDQNFFFPSGVKVDLVSPAVSALLTRPSNSKRHIVQFSDEVGQITYACCLTTTHSYSLDEIKAIDEKIILNLIKINKMKHAANCIQKCFRKFAERKKSQAWLKSAHNVSRTESFITATNSEASHAGNSKKGFFAKIFGQKSASAKPAAISASISNSSSSDLLGSTSHGFGALAPEASKPGHVRKPSAVPTLEPIRVSAANINTVATSGNGATTPNNIAAKRKGTLTNFFGGGLRLREKDSNAEQLREDLTMGLNTSSSESLFEIDTRRSVADAYRINVVDDNFSLKKKIIEESQKPTSLDSEERKEVTYVILGLIESLKAAEHQRIESNGDRNSVPVREVTAPLTPPGAFSKTVKNLIIFDILQNKWSIEDLEDILASVLGSIEAPTGKSRSTSVDGTETVTTENVPDAIDELPKLSLDASRRLFQVDRRYHINYGDSGSNGRVDEEASLWETIHASKHVVTTQRAFCIVSSVPEYTYIFKVLDAIVDAERNIHNGSLAAAFSIAKDSEEKFEPRERSLSTQSNKINASPCPSTSNKQLLELYENRQDFLDLVRTYMYHRHYKTAGSVQDLPLNFTITNKTSAKVSNTILKKFALSKDSVAGSLKPQTKRIYEANASISRHSASALVDTFQMLQPEESFSISRSDCQANFDFDSPVFSVTIPKYIKFSIDTQSLLNTKEWTCAVLFTHLSSQIIFQIMNLLLMEKSLIIYGKHAGIVTSITLAVINLISPFIWEGLFVPLVPDNARDLFGAPVPMILGTTSPPNLTGDSITPFAAILYLNDDLLVAKMSNPYSTKSSRSRSNSDGSTPDLEFMAWFVRLPEVSASMPVDDEISKRMEYTRSLLCHHYLKQLEFVEQGNPRDVTVRRDSHSEGNSSAPTKPIGNRIVKNTLDMLLMANVPELITKNVQILIAAIKRYNFHFFSSLVTDTASWKRFLKQTSTGAMEFFPASFMEPLRNHLEFQEAVVHTQLFVAFMDKLRRDNRLLDNVRSFIGHWIYFRIVLRNKSYQKGQNKLRKKLTKG